MRWRSNKTKKMKIMKAVPKISTAFSNRCICILRLVDYISIGIKGDRGLIAIGIILIISPEYKFIVSIIVGIFEISSIGIIFKCSPIRQDILCIIFI